MATARKVGRPMKKKSTGLKLGKAAVLSGPLWRLWMQHVWAQGPTWLWVALFLSHALCSRITEVLRLRASDFKWKSHSVYVAALKRCPGTQKHMMKAIFPELRQLREQGARKRRHRRWGARGVVHFWDSWTWPESEGLLFKSSRCDSHLVRRNKDTAAKAVARLRQSFDPPKKNIFNAQRIRTHSARHTMINNFKDAQVSDHAGMRMARISDYRTASYSAILDTLSSAPLASAVCIAGPGWATGS